MQNYNHFNVLKNKVQKDREQFVLPVFPVCTLDLYMSVYNIPCSIFIICCSVIR